jgi:hypothetical protein
MNEGNTARKKKIITNEQSMLVSVLKSMCSEGTSARQLMISEIRDRSGINDEKEVQRHLYILEGQKLVTPMPPGDFTSKHWQITRDGVRALKLINNSAVS